MEYRIVRSKRKTLSLQITQQGEVLVRAPMNCPKDYIDRFVHSKEAWITEHLSSVQGYLASQAAFRPVELETMRFCGKELKVIPAEGNIVRLDLRNMEIHLPDASVQALLPSVEKLYKRAGLPWLKQRMDHWARIMSISYGEVKFSSALKRWGSCSAAGNIRITWMLLFAPPSAIDYVLVHELAHRRVFDHSSAFWAVVEQYVPDYKRQKLLLKQLSEELYAQGWSKKYE